MSIIREIFSIIKENEEHNHTEFQNAQKMKHNLHNPTQGSTTHGSCYNGYTLSGHVHTVK